MPAASLRAFHSRRGIRDGSTSTQPWRVGDVTVEPNGGRYEMRGAAFFTVDADALIDSYRYLHTGSFTQTFDGVMTDEFYAAYLLEFFT